jgi:triosephosphate isomerase
MQRRFLIAANLKMNPIPPGVTVSGSPYFGQSKVDVVVFATFFDLQDCAQHGIVTGAQFGRPEPQGAFTGDVSMAMIAAPGVQYVLCGHSERRRLHDEEDEDVACQVKAAIDAHLQPIVCVGERAEERRRGDQEQVVERQLRVLPLDAECLTIAYEPVWAIGKDALRAATSDEAQAMHKFIRSLLPAERKEKMRIIYGGNLNAGNADGILRQPDIDGGLVGGASLNPVEFRKIVEIADRLSHSKA